MSSRIAAVILFIAMQPALVFATPDEQLARIASANTVIEEFISLASSRLSRAKAGTDMSTSAELTQVQSELEVILDKLDDPGVVRTVAMVSMGYSGSYAGDEAVSDVFSFAVDASINRLAAIASPEALNELLYFRARMRPDGGLAILVEEAIETIQSK